MRFGESRARLLIAGRFLTLKRPIRSVSARVGGRSSMVEPQIVILVVAGSSPVGHPTSPLGTDPLPPSGTPIRQRGAELFPASFFLNRFSTAFEASLSAPEVFSRSQWVPSWVSLVSQNFGPNAESTWE